MAIQNRRGSYADFDPSKLLPGEWAVVQSNDTHSSDGKAVYMAFASGDVKRMATYEDIEDDLANATEEAVESATQTAEDYSLTAEAFATGKENGEDVPSDNPAYHNNAKYYSDQLASVSNAMLFFDEDGYLCFKDYLDE